MEDEYLGYIMDKEKQKICPCCEGTGEAPEIWAVPGSKQIWLLGKWIPVQPQQADVLSVLQDYRKQTQIISPKDLDDQVFGKKTHKRPKQGCSTHISQIRGLFKCVFNAPLIISVYGGKQVGSKTHQHLRGYYMDLVV